MWISHCLKVPLIPSEGILGEEMQNFTSLYICKSCVIPDFAYGVCPRAEYSKDFDGKVLRTVRVIVFFKVVVHILALAFVGWCPHFP